MKLFTWLRALLPRLTPAAGPAARQSAAATQPVSYSGPLVPVPPPTPAQREARMQARQPDIAEAAARSQAREAARGVPFDLYRLDVELAYLRFDLAEARGLNWVVDELHLQAEIQRVSAELQLRLWQHSLVEHYGPELGAQLGQYEVAVGMRWEHVVVCYGPPPAGAMQQVAGHPNHWRVQYGRPATGSYFELVDDVVTVARLGVPTLPAHLVQMLDFHQ